MAAFFIRFSQISQIDIINKGAHGTIFAEVEEVSQKIWNYNTEELFDKRVKVHTNDGANTEGVFYGYNYDYDDDGKEIVEFDLLLDNGLMCGFSDFEVDYLEII